jgi:hypothetical protein
MSIVKHNTLGGRQILTGLLPVVHTIYWIGYVVIIRNGLDRTLHILYTNNVQMYITLQGTQGIIYCESVMGVPV